MVLKKRNKWRWSMALIEKTLYGDLPSCGSTNCETTQPFTLRHYTAQKMKFSVKDFFIFAQRYSPSLITNIIISQGSPTSVTEASHTSTETASVTTQAKISNLRTATSSLEYYQRIFLFLSLHSFERVVFA